MNKYQYAKKKIKDFCDYDDWQYVKTVQRQFADVIINSYIPEGLNAITVPFPQVSCWYFPLPRKSEKKTGYRSRLMAWLWLYIYNNLTERWNEEDEGICNLIYPENIPGFCLEGVKCDN